MGYDIQEFNRLIENRRSVFPKMFSGEAVPAPVVEKMLENANWAPTHKFTEPWRFVVFTGQGIKKLAEYQSAFYQRKSLEEGTFDEIKFLKLKEKPFLASHIIAIGMRRDPEERIPEVEEIAAVSCAVQNMYLTATAYGVGCYWSTGGVTYWEDSKPFFGLQNKDRLLGFLFLGMYSRKDMTGRRGHWRDKVVWMDQ